MNTCFIFINTHFYTTHRALVALINEVKPGVAPDVSKLDPTKRQYNCNLAINIAFNHLKIPKLISANNLCRSTIDELSIITYLSYFRDPARARLLKWVRKMLPQFDISNFLTDWTDGRAYAALTNKCFPGILSQYVSLEKENAQSNIQLVLQTIKRKLGITPNFTARKMSSGKVDELQVMTIIMRIRDGRLQPLPDEIVVSGPGIQEAAIGKATYFSIDTAQAGPGKLTVEAIHTPGGRKADCSFEKDDRVVTVSYSPDYAGKLTINVQWSGVHVPNSPFQVRVSDSMMVKIVDFDHHRRVVHVNKPIELSLNTDRAGQGTLTAHLKYSSEAPIPAEVIRIPNSVTKLRYIPPKCGQAVLHVFWNEEELNHLTIAYTVLDIASYEVLSKPETRLYRVLEDIKFSIQIKGAGNLNALNMTAILEGDEAQVPLRFDVVDGYTGHAIFRPTLAGRYSIEIACIDQLVHGSPFSVDVVDPSQCKPLGSFPKYLQLNQPHTFEIDMRDAGRGALTFECEEHQAAATTFEVNSSPPDYLGISKVEVTPLREGRQLLTLKFQGTEIPGCPFHTFICDPSRCRVSGEVLEKRSAMIGKVIRFQVTVDPIGGLKPSIKATGPSAKYTPAIRETNQNVYTVQFTPWEIGTHDISITYGDFHIPNSPFLVSVTTFNSATCSATGSGLQQAFTGIPAQFIVLAKQEGLLKDGTLKIKVKGVVNDTECKIRGRDNHDGSYNIAYLVPNPGAYLISIFANDNPIPGSPFRLTALPGPTANKCRMYGPILQPNAVLTIGNPMDFSVDASAAGVGALSVKAIGPGGTQARVYLAKGNKKGIHNIKLDPIRHGKYRVSVKWSEEHIPGSPFMLKIYPGADASKCRAYGPGLEDGHVGRASSFMIETRDAGAGTLQVRLHGVRDAFKIDIKPVDQRDIRTLKANYNPRKPGDYLVTIKWSEKHIPGSPFRVRIMGDIIVTDSPNLALKATPRDESLNPIAEEVDEENWGDEEDDGEMANPNVPAQSAASKRKKKKKNKKSSSKEETATSSANPTTSQEQNNPENAIPMFNPTSRVTYKDAFVGGASESINKKVKGGKFFKTMKGGKGAPSKSASTSVLPRAKMITFSGLQQLQKQSLPQSSPYFSARDYYAPTGGPPPMAQMNGIRGLPHKPSLRSWNSDSGAGRRRYK